MRLTRHIFESVQIVRENFPSFGDFYDLQEKQST